MIFSPHNHPLWCFFIVTRGLSTSRPYVLELTVHGQWRSISAAYTHLHDTPNSKQLFTNPTAVLFSTLIHWTNPYTDQAWEPDWTRIGPPWPLSDKPICLTKLLPTQTILASSSYKNYCWTFPWQSYQLVCVVRPTTPTTADKNLLCPLIRQTIVWVFMAVPNGVSDNTLRNDFFFIVTNFPDLVPAIFCCHYKHTFTFW